MKGEPGIGTVEPESLEIFLNFFATISERLFSMGKDQTPASSADLGEEKRKQTTKLNENF